MKQHKWHKEIKAWADGLEVQARFVDRKNYNDDWDTLDFSNVEIINWNNADFEFRIKPQPKEPTHVVQFTDEQLEQIQKAIKYASDNPITQPKEPQYLYVYVDDDYKFATIKLQNVDWQYVGKIKLEVDDGN